MGHRLGATNEYASPGRRVGETGDADGCVNRQAAPPEVILLGKNRNVIVVLNAGANELKDDIEVTVFTVRPDCYETGSVQVPRLVGGRAPFLDSRTAGGDISDARRR